MGEMCATHSVKCGTELGTNRFTFSKYNMNIPNQLQLLYECKIELTNDYVHRFDRIDFSKTVSTEQLANIKPEPVVSIRMPASEYERFCKNWNQYMDVMQLAMSDPMIKDQYRQLLMLVELKK